MENLISIKLEGPLTDDGDMIPALGDTVGVIQTDGRLRLLTITGSTPTLEGQVLYASGGEKVALSDCYLLIACVKPSVEES